MPEQPQPSVQEMIPTPSPDLVISLREGSGIAVVGAGLSIPAGAPTWAELITGIAVEAVQAAPHERKKVIDALRVLGQNGYLEATSMLKAILGDVTFRSSVIRQLTYCRRSWSSKELLENLSTVDNPANLTAGQKLELRQLEPTITHIILAQLPFRALVTTNYDTLLENAWAAVYRSQIPSYSRSYRRLGPLMQERNRFILKLHGDLNHPDDIVLAREDYADAVFDERVRKPLRHLFGTNKALWLGYGHRDPDLDLLLDESSSGNQLHGGFATAKEEDYRLAARFQAVNIAPIWLPTYDVLPDYLLGVASAVDPSMVISWPVHLDIPFQDAAQAESIVKELTRQLSDRLNGEIRFDDVHHGSIRATLKFSASTLRQLRLLRLEGDPAMREVYARYRIQDLGGDGLGADDGNYDGPFQRGHESRNDDDGSGLQPQPVAVLSPPGKGTSQPTALLQPEHAHHHADDLYGKLWTLANNLWWSWHPECDQLFRDIDPIRWRQIDHNPIALLREMTPEQMAERASELVLQSRINYAYRRLQEYLATSPQWAATNAGVLGSKPVAYFSAEFGIHESVPIYSGGLGVLSGDHVKSASGLGVPLVGVGLYYSHGYFRQHLDDDGYQGEDYLQTDIDNLPMTPAVDAHGDPITVSIETRNGQLLAKVWLMNVGRVRLYLLDCNVEGNKPEDRELTSRLYGGDQRTRIRQELVLGVGGVKALHALGIDPGVYHLNEGHSAFGPLQVIHYLMHEDGKTFADAKREATRMTCFTTHTPVPAGHDRFPPDLVEEHLGPLRDSLGLSEKEFMAFGRVDADNIHETFCMTVIGFNLSRYANAVSNLHGVISRRMWAHHWPDRVEEEVPIGHITNGVHVPSWLAGQMALLYDKHFPVDWKSRIQEAEVWHSIYSVDPGELWETHNALKIKLLSFVRRRVSRQCRRRGESDAVVEAARRVLDPRVLTIGFGRRFATYKRANLLFTEIDRVAELLQSHDRPIQLIYAGKAHPKDEPGKRFIQEIANLRHDPRFAGRVAFVEDYDINVCRHLIHGVDVWLNNPRRPLEASGTSGQKVVLNGGLNCSILDGWWAEAYNGMNGFAIGQGRSHVHDHVTDQRDADALYDTLENRIIPCYYDRDDDGLPKEWIDRMMQSISTLAWRFSSHRMVADYTKRAYLCAAGGVTNDMRHR